MKKTKWEKYEIKFLRDNYSYNGVDHCSDKLNRSVTGIRRKAKKLGLKKYTDKSKYLKYNLVNVINKCETYTEVLNELGMRNAGGNFKTIKKYIELYNIDISHFNSDEYKLKKKNEKITV